MFNVNILLSKESYKILCMLWLHDNKYNWKFLYPNINSDVGIVTSLSSFIPFVPPFLTLSSLLSFISLSFLFSTMPIYKASLVVQSVKNLPAMWGTQVRSLGQEDPLEKGTATHSSCLENFMDRGAWWVTDHGVTKTWLWLSD